MDLTLRQKEILKSIIYEFFDTAQAVGSLTLYTNYRLGVSPATLRSEMSTLMKKGYLYKPHSSAGRVPTTMGIRYFIDEFMKEKVMDSISMTTLKERLFQDRFNRNKFLHEAVKALSEISNTAAITIVDDVVYISGLSNLAGFPEFEDHALLQNALNIVDSDDMLIKLFQKFMLDDKLRILVGDEIGIDSLSECSIICSPFNYYHGRDGFIASVGPRRMNYASIVPIVRTISHFIEEAISGW